MGDWRRLAYGLALLTPAALLGGALVAQYGFGLPPCEMCWWQRYPHIAALVLAVAAYILLKVIIGFAAAIAGTIVIIAAIVAVIWALKVLL